MHKMRALTNSKTRRIVVTSKVPGEMNLNVNIHRKPYFNIYQNENGNLSSNKIEREKQKKKESTKENNSNECRREKNTVSDFFIS